MENFKKKKYQYLLYWSIPLILLIIEKFVFKTHNVRPIELSSMLIMQGFSIVYMYAIYIFLGLLLPEKINAIFFNIIMGFVYTTNYYVDKFRGNCIIFSDFSSIKTAINVGKNYTIKPDLTIILIWIFLIILNIVIYKNITIRQKFFHKLLNILILFIIYFIELTIIAVTDINIIARQNNTANAYYQGYFFMFSNSIIDSQAKIPEGYNQEKAEQILKKYTDNNIKNNKNEQKPNVIIIMNEAFSDLNVLGDVKADQDYMPYIHELQKSDNTITGTFNTYVVGGGTYKSENEVLTGESGRYTMGYDTIYNPVESLASIFKENGYNTYASHPYDRNGYNRNNAYPLLGFQKIWFIEDTDFNENRYMTDKEYYDLLIKDYKENKKTDKPLFYFGVTMQNHSPYTKYAGMSNKKVTSSYNNDQLNIYLSDVYASDQAFKYLCEYFKDKENTIIVMFGDHQPAQDVVDDINSDTETENRYKTPFVIWANYDIKSEHDINTSGIYLGNKILKIVNIPLTPFRNLIDTMEKEYPIFAYIIYNKNNEKVDDITEIDIIKEYRCANYYMRHRNITPD